jgi:hypothetical protein
MKYPNLEKMGLLVTDKEGNVKLNEDRFLSSITYTLFREFEDRYHYPKMRLEEVEEFLANKTPNYREEE